MSGTGKLTVGSLFAGIGGFDLGLERAGHFETKWFCEVDPYCRRVLAQHWPGTPCHGDIRHFHARSTCPINGGCGEDLEPVDVLCGGFPCQDISLAGRGAGLAGARSGLWSEYARLVRELRPRYVIVENVPALRKRGLEVVLADLMACGYDAEWDGIPAAAVGAPHQRDRIWIVAYPSGTGRRQDPGRAHADEGEHAGRPAQDDHFAGSARPGWLLPALRGSAVADPQCTGLEGRVLGNTGAPQVAEPRPDPEPERRVAADAPGVGQREPSDQADPVATGGDARQVAGSRAWRLGEYEPAVQRWEGLSAVGAPFPVLRGVDARLPDWMDRTRALGNALVPQIAEWLGYRIAEHEELI